MCIRDRLEAIGHHIQLIKEEARAEKENTKEMVSDISHQLKTPVAALDTCFSVLMQNDLSATEQEMCIRDSLGTSSVKSLKNFVILILRNTNRCV